MNIRNKYVIILFNIFIIMIYSCDQNNDSLKNDEPEQKIKTILLTPDSLRTKDDKILLQKMEAVYYEDCTVKNGRFELNISKKDLISKGIPSVCYDMLKKDFDDINKRLGTPLYPKEVFFDSFKKSQEEYFAKKKSQLPE